MVTTFCIVVDTREQNPYGDGRIKFNHPHIRGTLRTGDYSILGCEERIAIERKSLADWAGSITQGRERFEREIVRLSELEFGAVVIEADMRSVYIEPLHSKVSRNALVNTALKWTVKYGVPIQFVSNRSGGRNAVEAYCEAFWKYNVMEDEINENERATDAGVPGVQR
jgi:ERCC4-type nuclease